MRRNPPIQWDAKTREGRVWGFSVPDVALVQQLGKGSWTTAYLGADGHAYLHTNAEADQGKQVLQEARQRAAAAAKALLPDLRELGAGNKPGWVVFRSERYRSAAEALPGKEAADWWKILTKSYWPIWDEWTRNNLNLQGRHQRAAILELGEQRAIKEKVADDPRFLALREAMRALHEAAPASYGFELQRHNLAWTEAGQLILLDVLFPAHLYEFKIVEAPMRKRRNPPSPDYKMKLGKGAFTTAYGREPTGVNVAGNNVDPSDEGVELLTKFYTGFAGGYDKEFDLAKVALYLARKELVDAGKTAAAAYFPVIRPSRVDWTNPDSPELVYLTSPFKHLSKLAADDLGHELVASLHRDVTGTGPISTMISKFQAHIARAVEWLRKKQTPEAQARSDALHQASQDVCEALDALAKAVTLLPKASYYGGDLHDGNFAVDAQTGHLLLTDPIVYNVDPQQAIKYWYDSGLPTGPASAPGPAGPFAAALLGTAHTPSAPAMPPAPQKAPSVNKGLHFLLTEGQLAMLLVRVYAGHTRVGAIAPKALKFPIDMPWVEQLNQLAPDLVAPLQEVAIKLIRAGDLRYSQGHWKVYGPEAVVYTAAAAVKAEEAAKAKKAPPAFWSPPKTETVSDARLVIKILNALGKRTMAADFEHRYNANRPATGVPWERLAAPLGKEIVNKIGEVIEELRREDLLERTQRGFWRLTADDSKIGDVALALRGTGAKASGTSSDVNDILVNILKVGRAEPAKPPAASPDRIYYPLNLWARNLLNVINRHPAPMLISELEAGPLAGEGMWSFLERVLGKSDAETVKQLIIDLVHDEVIIGDLRTGFAVSHGAGLDAVREWLAQRKPSEPAKRSWSLSVASAAKPASRAASGTPPKVSRLAECYADGEHQHTRKKGLEARVDSAAEVVAYVLGYAGAIEPDWAALLKVAEQEPDAAPADLVEDVEDGGWEPVLRALERDGRVSQLRNRWLVLVSPKRMEEVMDEAREAARAKLAPNPATGGWRRATLADKVAKAYVAWKGHGASRRYFACDTLAEAKKVAGV